VIPALTDETDSASSPYSASSHARWLLAVTAGFGTHSPFARCSDFVLISEGLCRIDSIVSIAATGGHNYITLFIDTDAKKAVYVAVTRLDHLRLSADAGKDDIEKKRGVANREDDEGEPHLDKQDAAGVISYTELPKRHEIREKGEYQRDGKREQQSTRNTNPPAEAQDKVTDNQPSHRDADNEGGAASRGSPRGSRNRPG